MFNVLQYLRAAAALLVVFYHLESRLRSLGYQGGWANWLSSGVDLFFVLSGFLMWITTAERRVKPFQFASRRLLRIVPIYWVLTCAVLVIALAVPALVSGGGVSATHILGSFLFFPVQEPGTGIMQPLIPQGWTLNFEMAFYATFAVSLWLPSQLRLWAVLFALSTVASVSLAGIEEGTVLGFYGNPIVLEFAFGVGIGAIWLRRPAIAANNGALIRQRIEGATWLIVGVMLFAAATEFLPNIDRAWKWGAPAALIIYGALHLEGMFKVSTLRILGDASYSIYLCHGVALSALLFVWKAAGLATNPFSIPAFAIVGSVGAIATGWLIYERVEKPMLRILGGRPTTVTDRLETNGVEPPPRQTIATARVGGR